MFSLGFYTFILTNLKTGMGLDMFSWEFYTFILNLKTGMGLDMFSLGFYTFIQTNLKTSQTGILYIYTNTLKTCLGLDMGILYIYTN